MVDWICQKCIVVKLGGCRVNGFRSQRVATGWSSEYRGSVLRDITLCHGVLIRVGYTRHASLRLYRITTGGHKRPLSPSFTPPSFLYPLVDCVNSKHNVWIISKDKNWYFIYLGLSAFPNLWLIVLNANGKSVFDTCTVLDVNCIRYFVCTEICLYFTD